ncbi:MAG: hypothetical protein ABL886_12265, partial [Rhodoglobus sp.]
ITVETAGIDYLIRGLRFELTEQTEVEMFGVDTLPMLEDGEVLGGFTFNKPIVLGEQGTVIPSVTWLVNVGRRKASMVDVIRELTGATRLMLDQLYGHPVTPMFMQFEWSGPGEDPASTTEDALG